MSRNEITGDEIKSKTNSKEYEDNYDRIFKRKPESLDAAYERRAMEQGLVVNPLFDENKELVEDWPHSEDRINVIGQNGNEGLHYKECKCSFRGKLLGDGCEVCNPNRHDYLLKDVLCDICGKDLDKTVECAWTSCPLLFKENKD